MKDFRPVEGLRIIVLGALAAVAVALGPALADQRFPINQELLLDVPPIRPAKRVPALMVDASGAAKIDLWCKSVSGQVEISDASIRIVAEPLPDAMPQWLSKGQCTPQRMQADEDVLAALTQVTGWRRQGRTVLLLGPRTLKFRPSDH